MLIVAATLCLLITVKKVEAQRVRILTDSSSGHGLLIFDRQYSASNWGEVRRIVDSVNGRGDGWHVPSRKEMEMVFYRTYDRRQLRSSLTPSDCVTSDYIVDGASKDTVHYVGVMRGREFKVGLPLQERGAHFFLVKQF